MEPLGFKPRSSRTLVEVQEETPEELVQCPLCSFKSKHQTCLWAHLKIHTQEKPWQCDQCPASFRTRYSFEAHQLSYHGMHSGHYKVYQCDKCEYKSMRVRVFQDHLLFHSEIRSFACPVPGCSAAFKYSGGLRRHTAVEHSDSQSFLTCSHPDCHYAAKRYDSLASHLKLVHGPSEEIPCPEPGCTYIAKSRAHLKDHAKRHGEKEFKCTFPQCNASFVQERGLKSHQRIHDPTRPYSCDLCPYRSKRSGEMVAHKKLNHAADIELKNCPFCDYKTKYPSALKSHIDCMHKAQPLKCPEEGCPYKNHSEEMIRVHKNQRHNPASPYACHLCSLRFRKEQYLGKHLRAYHEGRKNYCKCSICDFRTTTNLKLNQHVEFKHPNGATVEDPSRLRTLKWAARDKTIGGSYQCYVVLRRIVLKNNR